MCGGYKAPFGMQNIYAKVIYYLLIINDCYINFAFIIFYKMFTWETKQFKEKNSYLTLYWSMDGGILHVRSSSSY